MTVQRSIRELGIELHTTDEGVGSLLIRTDSGVEVTDQVLGLIGDDITVPDDVQDALDNKEDARVIAAAAPTTGAHVVGDIVWHSTPAAAGFIGWVCTTAGTPGTFKTWGEITA